MPNQIKANFLKTVTDRYGPLHRLDRSKSLYEVGNGAARLYIRYSRLHGGCETFYGLRKEDLDRLEGHHSVICFLWDNQDEPLLVPFAEYEDLFQSMSPNSDGQYKTQVYLNSDGIELYIARAGRFNVEGHMGLDGLDALVDSSRVRNMPELSHTQVQTFLGAIGSIKGHDIWIPQSDRNRLDWSLTGQFECRERLPYGLESVQGVLQEVDVVWIHKGTGQLSALFEVEHSTPIYSGLLRFNDIHLVATNLRPRFYIVANDARHSLFVRQLNRPTFQMSGLPELCTFLEYVNVYAWYSRVKTV
jgi:hypothetical protein